MAKPDMSGYAGAGGADKWMQDSGGTMDQYNQQMQQWQGGQQQPQQQPQNQWQTNQGQGQQGQQQQNWAQMTPQQAGIQAWGAEIGQDNRQTANMTPEQRARWAMEHIDSLGSDVQGGFRDKEGAYNQWMAWDKSYDSNCPPDRPYQAEDGTGCVEKPDNTNQGYMDRGIMDAQGNWVPGGGGRGGGGGGRGGRGGGGGGYRSSGNPIFDYLQQSGLAAAKDPEAALKAYMGYGGAGQYQAQIDTARQEAESLPPGPARDAAMARLAELKTSGLSSMRQAASSAARGDLTGMLGTEQGYAQLAENARQANMQNALGWGGLDIQKMLGMGGLDLQNRQFGWESGQKWSDILAGQGADRALQEKLAQMQIKAGQPSGLQKAGSAIGTGLGIAASAAALL